MTELSHMEVRKVGRYRNLDEAAARDVAEEMATLGMCPAIFSILSYAKTLLSAIGVMLLGFNRNYLPFFGPNE